MDFRELVILLIGLTIVGVVIRGLIVALRARSNQLKLAIDKNIPRDIDLEALELAELPSGGARVVKRERREQPERRERESGKDPVLADHELGAELAEEPVANSADEPVEKPAPVASQTRPGRAKPESDAETELTTASARGSAAVETDDADPRLEPAQLKAAAECVESNAETSEPLDAEASESIDAAEEHAGDAGSTPPAAEKDEFEPFHLSAGDRIGGRERAEKRSVPRQPREKSSLFAAARRSLGSLMPGGRDPAAESEQAPSEPGVAEQAAPIQEVAPQQASGQEAASQETSIQKASIQETDNAGLLDASRLVNSNDAEAAQPSSDQAAPSKLAQLDPEDSAPEAPERDALFSDYETDAGAPQAEPAGEQSAKTQSARTESPKAEHASAESTLAAAQDLFPETIGDIEESRTRDASKAPRKSKRSAPGVAAPATRTESAPQSIAPEKETGAAAESTKAKQQPSAAGANSHKRGAESGDLSEVLVINVTAKKGRVLMGDRLMPMLLSLGLKFGDKQIFNKRVGDKASGDILFNVANMLKPGTFDLNEMERFHTVGVTLFLALPTSINNLDAFEQMLRTAQDLVRSLDGELRDDQRNMMTGQTIEHYRQRVRDFELQRLRARAASA